MIKDILTSQGINITLPDEALQYVIPKIATNKDTLLYILQIPKLEEEESTMMTIIPLVINNTVIGNYPQHLVKSNQKLFITSDHNSFVQKHSNIKEFRDKCIKPLIMGTKSICNVTTETETTIQYIAEDKILINNAKNENLYSDCGPNNRTITGNFIINFWNCTITFNNKKFHSYEIRSEVQIIQGALHNVEATRKLIPELNIDVIQQENIENRRKIEHVYLRQANHQTWIWTLTGGISASSIGIILLIIFIGIRKKRNRDNNTEFTGNKTKPRANYKMLKDIEEIWDQTEDRGRPFFTPGRSYIIIVTVSYRPNNIPISCSHCSHTLKHTSS